MSDKNFTLKFLDEFYKKSKSGCKTLEITTSNEMLNELLDQELIFRTKEGYFISTIGQDYLANISE